MEIPKLPKLNYDNFYKFMTSFAILIFILMIIFASFLLIYKDTYNIFTYWLLTVFFLLVAILSCILFLWATNKWKTKQEKFDKMEDIELSLKATELQKNLQRLPNVSPALGVSIRIRQWCRRYCEAVRQMAR